MPSLIPVDELGPGAIEAGVPQFIDRQLAGAYGAGSTSYLDGLRRGKVDLGAAGTSEFFELLLALTMAGYLSDPAYGGNRAMHACQMIGFPGAYSNYYDLVGRNVAQGGAVELRRSEAPAWQVG